MPALDSDQVFCASSPYAQSLTDEGFWAHVYLQEGMGEENDYVEPRPDWEEEIEAGGRCPLCGAFGACGWDGNGLPLIHAIPVAFDA